MTRLRHWGPTDSGFYQMPLCYYYFGIIPDLGCFEGSCSHSHCRCLSLNPQMMNLKLRSQNCSSHQLPILSKPYAKCGQTTP